MRGYTGYTESASVLVSLFPLLLKVNLLEIEVTKSCAYHYKCDLKCGLFKSLDRCKEETGRHSVHTVIPEFAVTNLLNSYNSLKWAKK